MATASPTLDDTFHALASATRRAVVERLARGPATVTELFAPFGMALPSFMQHLRVLEDCGLVRSKKQGRVRTVSVLPGRIKRAAGWLEKQRTLWETRLDQLDAYLDSIHDQEPDR